MQSLHQDRGKALLATSVALLTANSTVAKYPEPIELV